MPTGPGPGSTPVGATLPRTGTVAREPDATVWQLWWGYNNAVYVDIKGAVHSSDLLGGSAAFFLGRSAPGGASDRVVPSREVIEGRVVPALLSVLATERDADMVTGALVALAKIGEVGGPTSTSERISAFLADPNQEIAETAAISLGILADAGSVPVLSDLLFDRERARELVRKTEVPWRTRAFAAYGLGLIGHRVADEPLREGIVRTLLQALEAEEVLGLATPDVAVACITALGIVPLSTEVPAAGVGESGRMREIDALLAFGRRKEPSHFVRAHVPTALSRLLQGVPRSWGQTRRVCGAWLEDLRAEGVPRPIQQSSVLALGRVGVPGDAPIDREIRAALLAASRGSPNVEVRRFALIALAQIGSRAAAVAGEQEVAAAIRAHLTGLLAEGAVGERAWAALALGVLGRGASEEVERETDERLVAALAEARAPPTRSARGRSPAACAVWRAPRRSCSRSSPR